MLSIVYGHPYDGSFGHAILETILKKLRATAREHMLMDLYADHFDPAVREEDLALYSSGRTSDPLAMRYMEILRKTSEIIYIFPVWWGVEPAIVKGFHDKVLLKDFAWFYSDTGALSPLLRIGKTTVITTSEAPTRLFSAYFEDYLPEHVFSAVGMGNPVWLNLDNIIHCGEAARKEFLEKVEKLF